MALHTLLLTPARPPSVQAFSAHATQRIATYDRQCLSLSLACSIRYVGRRGRSGGCGLWVRGCRMEAHKEVWGRTQHSNIGARQQREADGLHWRHARHRHLRPQQQQLSDTPTRRDISVSSFPRVLCSAWLLLLARWQPTDSALHCRTKLTRAKSSLALRSLTRSDREG
jgi:hypothetical protein